MAFSFDTEVLAASCRISSARRTVRRQIVELEQVGDLGLAGESMSTPCACDPFDQLGRPGCTP
jgi:hypothetical protein